MENAHGEKVQLVSLPMITHFAKLVSGAKLHVTRGTMTPLLHLTQLERGSRPCYHTVFW